MLERFLNPERNPYRGVMLITIGMIGYWWFRNEAINRYQIGSIIVGLAGAVMLGTHWLSKLGPFYAERRRKKGVLFEVWQHALIPMEQTMETLEKWGRDSIPDHHQDLLQLSLQRVVDNLNMAQVPHPGIGAIGDVTHRMQWMKRLNQLITWCRWNNHEGYEEAREPGLY